MPGLRDQPTRPTRQLTGCTNPLPCYTIPPIADGGPATLFFRARRPVIALEVAEYATSDAFRRTFRTCTRNRRAYTNVDVEDRCRVGDRSVRAGFVDRRPAGNGCSRYRRGRILSCGEPFGYWRSARRGRRSFPRNAYKPCSRLARGAVAFGSGPFTGSRIPGSRSAGKFTDCRHTIQPSAI